MMVQVLATAASNMAVDNLVERLSKADPQLCVVRLGHPARLLPRVCLEIASDAWLSPQLDRPFADVNKLLHLFA